MKKFQILGLSAVLFGVMAILTSCPNQAAETGQNETEEAGLFTAPNVPDWHKNATIYEVNLRHYTPEGTFSAFAEYLPRLKKMGVDILWLMPIHPVSAERRKGELGSPYAVGDYYGVNPDFGTMDDFKNLLQVIHDNGMYCIIDWVPNHSGWDNPWITEHPDWYTKGKDGEITDPIHPETGESWGWTDVADLNYDVPGMRQGMIDAMQFWITEVGIDGFRVDVAHGVPVDFWEQARDSLYSIKPIFMLAEAEVPALINTGAFVMDYGWHMHHTLNQIAAYQGANREQSTKLDKGNIVETTDDEPVEKVSALAIDEVLAEHAKNYEQGYKMHFTSNHDENAWAGTEFARMGDGYEAFAVLTATFDGMPLLYTGMEAGMDVQLPFFTKDTIDWSELPYEAFYTTLFSLKHRNQALWNGEHGGSLHKIKTGNDENVYAFYREKNGDKVVVLLNLSAEEQSFKLGDSKVAGNYTDVFTGDSRALSEDMSMSLAPWEYLVLEQ